MRSEEGAVPSLCLSYSEHGHGVPLPEHCSFPFVLCVRARWPLPAGGIGSSFLRHVDVDGGSVGVNELFSHMCFCFNTFVSCFPDTTACGMISAPLVTAGTIKGLLLTGPGQLTPVFLLCHTVMVSIDRQLARIENPREDRRTSGRDCEGFSRLG